MIQQTKPHPPRSVLAALAVLIVGYATVVAYGPWTDAVSVTASLIATAIASALIYGLWRGNPLARGLIVLAMAGNLIFGFPDHASISLLRAANMVAALVIAALLLLPRVVTAMVTNPSEGSTPSPDPDHEHPMDTEALWEETDAGERR